MNSLNKKGIIEVLAMVKAGVMTPMYDDEGHIISVNVTANPDLKIKDVKYVKQVYGNMVMGSTKEECENDEKALYDFLVNFSNVDVKHLIEVASILNKDVLTEDDVEYLNYELKKYVERHSETKVIYKTVTEPAPEDKKKSRYPKLFDDLYEVDIPTLRYLMRTATRNHCHDLKNACRTVLRHKGVNC